VTLDPAATSDVAGHVGCTYRVALHYLNALEDEGAVGEPDGQGGYIHDDPPTADVIDAVLTHLIESKANIDDARDEYDPRVIQDIANTSVLRLHYRTEIRDR
jgi:hypothetical protein